MTRCSAGGGNGSGQRRGFMTAQWPARRMVTRLAAGLPGRKVHVTADSAYAGQELKELPDGVTWTTRLRSNAALYDLPPERTGKRGRPRARGDRLPSLAKIAATAAFSQVTVTRYATAGHSPADTAARRANAPWYTAKTEPSTADMTAKLRRVIIAARFKPLRPDQPNPEEIHAI